MSLSLNRPSIPYVVARKVLLRYQKPLLHSLLLQTFIEQKQILRLERLEFYASLLP